RVDLADDDLPLLLLDQHPDAAVMAAGAGLELLELLRREELTVGIVELLHEPTRRALVELRGVEGVDEAILDEPQDLVEQLRPLAIGARLEEERAREEGHEHDAGDGELTGQSHGWRSDVEIQ